MEMDHMTQERLNRIARVALFLATAYLIVLGAVLLRAAFVSQGDGTITFQPDWGEEQATKGYFFHVIAGLLILVWYARGSRSKLPLAFAALGCIVAGVWTYIRFSVPMLGLAGFLPAAFSASLYAYRRRHRRSATRDSTTLS